MTLSRSNSIGTINKMVKLKLMAESGQDLLSVAQKNHRYFAPLIEKADQSTDNFDDVRDFRTAQASFLSDLNTSIVDSAPGFRLGVMNGAHLIGNVASFGLVAENQPLAVMGGASRKTLTRSKVGGLLVFDKDIIYNNGAEAESFLGSQLRAAVAGSSNKGFLDLVYDSNAAVTPSTGTSVDAILADTKTGISTMETTEQSSIIMVVTSATLRSLTLKNENGQTAFPGLHLNLGGELVPGLRVYVCDDMPADLADDSNGSFAILVDTNGLLLNRGTVEFSKSEEALIEMSDAPDGTGKVVSMFQTESVCLRFVRTLAVEAIRDCVSIISGVNW